MIRIDNLLNQIKRGNIAAKKELDYYIDEAIKGALFTNQNGTINSEGLHMTIDLRPQIMAEVYKELNRKNELGKTIEKLWPKDILPIIKQNQELCKKLCLRLDVFWSMKEDFSPEERQGIERAINIIGGIYDLKREIRDLRFNDSDYSKKYRDFESWSRILSEFKKWDKKIDEKYGAWRIYRRRRDFPESAEKDYGSQITEAEKSISSEINKNPLTEAALEIYGKIFAMYVTLRSEALFSIPWSCYLPEEFLGSGNEDEFHADLTGRIEILLPPHPPTTIINEHFILPKMRVAPPRLLYDVLANLLKRKDGDTDNKKIATALRYLILRSQGTEKEFLFKKFLSPKSQSKNYPDPDDENKFRHYVESLRVRRMKYKKLKPEQREFYKRLVRRIVEYAFPAMKLKKTKR